MLTTKCPHCSATIHYKSDWSEAACTSCGENIPLTGVNLKFENAKSLRSIAMSLQILATAQTPPEARDVLLGYCLGPIDG